MDFLATPEMQDAIGTQAATISVHWAHQWLKHMNWRYGKQLNGMYMDGHKREDVVEYCRWFLNEYQQLERQMRRYDKDGNLGKDAELLDGEQPLQELTHDESTFYANDQ